MTPSADYIAALCGISRKAACNRLRKYARGEITRERLIKPYRAPEVRDDRRGNAEWLALGDKPRNMRLAAIPGCTATECRVFGIADAATPPAPGKAKINLAQQVAEMSGVCLKTARERVARFRKGEITYRDLYAKPKLEESRRSIDAVVARVGCCRSTAAARLRRFRVGLITEAQLYAPTTGGSK